MAEKIKNGELSVENEQVHESFFDYAQETIEFSIKGLCEEIAMYMVLTNSSTRATKRGDDEWYENLPGALSDIGEFIDNVVALPFAVGNLGLGWIR